MEAEAVACLEVGRGALERCERATVGRAHERRVWNAPVHEFGSRVEHVTDLSHAIAQRDDGVEPLSGCRHAVRSIA